MYKGIYFHITGKLLNIPINLKILLNVCLFFNFGKHNIIFLTCSKILSCFFSHKGLYSLMLKSSSAFMHRNSSCVTWSRTNSWDRCLIRMQCSYMLEMCMRWLENHSFHYHQFPPWSLPLPQSRLCISTHIMLLQFYDNTLRLSTSS